VNRKYRDWIYSLTDIKSFPERTKKVLDWVKQVYGAKKVILFYHDSRHLRYSISRHVGIPRSILGKFIFSKQHYVRLKNKKEYAEHLNRSTSIESWKWFSDNLTEYLMNNGFDRILPFWNGNECIGGLIFDHQDDILSEDKIEFERFSTELAYLLEIAYINEKYERQTWEKSVLLEVTKKISSFGDLQTVLDHIVDSLHEVIPYNAAAIFLVNEDRALLEYKTIRGFAENMKNMVELKVGKGIVGWAIKHKKEVIVPDVRKDNRYICARETTRSELVVPIIYDRKIIGAFNVESDQLYFFRYYHLDMMRAFAAQTAIVLHNSLMFYNELEMKQFEKDLAIAKGIQDTLLPQKVPVIDGYDFAARNIPSHTIGGDLYDYITIAPNEIGVAIGDVSGKGIPGALLMASIYTSFREQARQSRDTSQVMGNINVALHENSESDKFATFFYGILNHETGEFRYSNAGHNPPLLLCEGEKFLELKHGGSVIGFVSDIIYDSGSVTLKSNDMLFLYTDGLSEAENENEEQFGIDRILECLKINRSKTAEKIIDSLLYEIRRFTGNGHHEDDLTMVVIKKL